MVWREAGGAEEEVGEEPGPASAPTDKLLFTVQIYDCFYGPNRKAARFTVANGTGAVGGTPGDPHIPTTATPTPLPGPAAPSGNTGRRRGVFEGRGGS